MGISGKNKLRHTILSLTVCLVATQNFATDKCHTSEKKFILSQIKQCFVTQFATKDVSCGKIIFCH
jgi:hypothetical protein